MKKPITPKSRVRACLRQLWLRSRERAAALKRDDYTCQDCGKKKSTRKGQVIKVEVHHLDQIDWSRIEEYIYRHLLVDPKKLIVLCKECHLEETRLQKRIENQP